MHVAQTARPDHRELRVLFVNTRDTFGADVAVHITLARELAAAGMDVTFATNSQARDHEAVVKALDCSPGVRVLLCALGQPLAGGAGAQRLASAIGNAPMALSVGRLAS